MLYALVTSTAKDAWHGGAQLRIKSRLIMDRHVTKCHSPRKYPATLASIRGPCLVWGKLGTLRAPKKGKKGWTAPVFNPAMPGAGARDFSLPVCPSGDVGQILTRFQQNADRSNRSRGQTAICQHRRGTMAHSPPRTRAFPAQTGRS